MTTLYDRVGAADDNPRSIALIGAPIDEGAGHPGAIMGPAALRVAGLGASLEAVGHRVVDLGDVAAAAVTVPEGGNLRNHARIAGWAKALADAGTAALDEGHTPIFMGGDHSLAMGTIAGVARHFDAAGRALHVLWLDAHADFNTPATSPSGNMHGMPVACLCGEPGLETVRELTGGVVLDPRRIHQIGIRSIDREERALIRERGIDCVDMRLVDEHGVVAPLRRILDAVAAEDGVLHVSLDVDFLDPAIAPGVGTTVPGGATYREAHLIMEMVHDSGLVCSMDIAELNPFLDERGRSARLLVELAGSLFGQQIIDRPSSLQRRG